jgi:HD-GYP domain-containing protein (c-di-GMP phosphodiesterase class II)
MQMLLDNLPNAPTGLHPIFAALPDLVFILDRHGIVLDYKTGDLGPFRAFPESWRGELVQAVLPPEIGRKLSSAFQPARSKQITSSLEYSVIVAGRERWFEARFAPSSQAQFVVFIRDITPHKQTEEKNQRQLESLVEELERTNLELARAYNTVIEGWSRALELRDRDTQGHTRRVTGLALKLGERLGLGETELMDIRRGAVLHDIGKIAVPDSILLKPGPLTAEEWKVIRRHPAYAVEMLAPIPRLGAVVDIPHYHHEKWDGSGYPHGLKEMEIPFNARLFAIVDVYDALTSDRPYRRAWTKDRAIVHIKDQAGSHFDPRMTGEFLAMLQAGSLSAKLVEES